MAQDIQFIATDGSEIRGYLAEAASGTAGIVVVSEWWGLQDQIKRICDRFAEQGISALAPDLYGGKVVPYHDMDLANQSMASLDFMQATDVTIGSAVDFLRKRCDKVALTGFCMGGALTILGALRLKSLDAAICFYGLPPVAAGDVSDIKIPLQGHFASQDFWCTPSVVNACEAKLKQGGVNYEFFTYQAQHAFMNEQRLDVYNAEVADLAWQRCLEFCRQYLSA